MAKVLKPIQIAGAMTKPPGRHQATRLLTPGTVGPALKQSLIMLRPDIQWKNPVMFVVEVGAFLTLAYLIQALLGKSESQVSTGYFVALDIWLFLTVLFANFATALAEARGRAQADSLKKTRRDTIAHRLTSGDKIEEVTSTVLKIGDRVVIETGQIVPGDGEIIEGIASIDESAITGESAPVIREAGGDRSGVTGGTLVVSDRIIVRITSGAGESFLDRMIGLVEGAIRQRTPNEIALTLVLSAFTDLFDRGDSALAHGTKCRAVYDELSRPSRTPAQSGN
jgi:potassium-transporting ATPase ATP-binding subunit